MKLSERGEYSDEMKLNGEGSRHEPYRNAVVFEYYERLGIRLKGEKGPYYLAELYQLYAGDGSRKAGPSQILQVGAYYERRYHHVTHALRQLLKKIALRDPETAGWQEKGLFEHLTLLFQHMEGRQDRTKDDAG